MKWILLGITVAAVTFYFMGNRASAAGRSADESIAAVIPWSIAAILLGADVLLCIGWLIVIVARS